jgi:hypothetical protein
MTLDKHVNLVNMFSTDDFVSPSTQDDMCIILFHGKRGGYTGEKMSRKFKDCRKGDPSSIHSKIAQRYLK